MKLTFRLFLAISAAVTLTTVQAAAVYSTDFIPDATRTNFNGFEGVTFDAIYGQTHATYTEGGIRVTQVNEKSTNPQLTLATTFMSPGFEGNRSWYSGGDNGYTSIQLENGSDFQSVGFLRGTGWVSPVPDSMLSSVYFELWNDGIRVQSGRLGPDNYLAKYIGFSGGGFDEIRIRDSRDLLVSGFGDGSSWLGGNNGDTTNALAIDSIEVGRAIPEPPTSAMLGIGVLALAALRRRRNAD